MGTLIDQILECWHSIGVYPLPPSCNWELLHFSGSDPSLILVE